MEPFIVLPSVLTIGLFTWGVRIVLKMRGRKVLVREFLSYFSELGHEVRIHADGPAIMGELGHMNVPPPNGRGQPLGTKEPASGVLVATTPPGKVKFYWQCDSPDSGHSRSDHELHCMLAAPIGLSSHETLRTVGRLDWGRSEFRTGDSAFDKGFHLGGSQSAWLARLNDESRELFNG